jgi:hypothetical protein
VTPLRAVDREVLVYQGLLALVVISLVATGAELATERHWSSAVQLIPWVALGVLVVATALLAARGPRAARLVRALAVLVLLTSAYGIVQHVVVNYDAGALDASYGQGWDALPVTARLWYAVSKSVGPAPPLAPGVLGQSALMVLLASFVRPARSRPERPSSS